MKKFSPSKINFIEECVLRYVKHINNHSSKSKKTFNKDTFLGIAIHSVIQDYINSPYQITKFGEHWDHILIKSLTDFGEPNNLEIIKYHLPHYAVKKEQTKNLLLKLKLKNAKAEQTVSGSIVHGKADLVERSRFTKKVKITDFKTGPIWEVKDGICVRLKTQYIKQLKTYGLVFWEKGFKPENIICFVSGLAKDELKQFTFTEKEYAEHRAFLYNLKNRITEFINSNNDYNLATPSSKACRYCEYSNICFPLHNMLLLEPAEFESMQLINSKNCTFKDQFLKIEFQQNAYKTTIQKIPNSVYFQLKEIVLSDKAILLTNLYNLINSEIKIWSKFSEFWIIE